MITINNKILLKKHKKMKMTNTHRNKTSMKTEDLNWGKKWDKKWNKKINQNLNRRLNKKLSNRLPN